MPLQRSPWPAPSPSVLRATLAVDPQAHQLTFDKVTTSSPAARRFASRLRSSKPGSGSNKPASVRLRVPGGADLHLATRSDQRFHLVNGSVHARADLGGRGGAVQKIKSGVQVVQCGPQHMLSAIGIAWHLRFPLTEPLYVGNRAENVHRARLSATSVGKKRIFSRAVRQCANNALTRSI